MRQNWQLGYMTARNAALLEQLATLRASSPTPTPPASLWGAARTLVERMELGQRGLGAALGLWRLWRAVSWPMFVGTWGAAIARWAGLL